MKEKFEELNIAKVIVDVDELEGSWAFLKEKFNRANIPVNVLYPTDTERLPVILPEFIGPDHVLKGIEKAQ